jgi:hypothetical protein
MLDLNFYCTRHSSDFIVAVTSIFTFIFFGKKKKDERKKEEKNVKETKRKTEH